MAAQHLTAQDVLFLLYLVALLSSGAGTGWMVLKIREAWSRLGELDQLTTSSCGEADGENLEVGGRVTPLRTFLSPMSHRDVVFAQVRRLHEEERVHASTVVNPDKVGPWSRHPGVRLLMSDHMRTSGPEHLMAQLTMGEPFYLEDKTGRVLVQPEVVPCALKPTVEDGKRKELMTPAERPILYHLTGVLERRLGFSFWVERVVAAGDEIYAHGDVKPQPNARMAQEGEQASVMKLRMLSSISKEALLGLQTWRLVLSAVGIFCGVICPVGLLLLPAPDAHPLLTRLWLWVWLASFLLNFVAHWMMSTRRTFFHRLSSRGGTLVLSAVMMTAAVYVFQYHGGWTFLMKLAGLGG